ncbi:MAG: hypothetical protein AB3N20_17095 [Rhizobiaceae bacterium]
MKPQIGLTGRNWPGKAAEPRNTTAGETVNQENEPCRDIVEAARSLGFSRKELLEIKRVYQTKLKRRHR